jgi:hypothetical protein
VCTLLKNTYLRGPSQSCPAPRVKKPLKPPLHTPRIADAHDYFSDPSCGSCAPGCSGCCRYGPGDTSRLMSFHTAVHIFGWLCVIVAFYGACCSGRLCPVWHILCSQRQPCAWMVGERRPVPQSKRIRHGVRRAVQQPLPSALCPCCGNQQRAWAELLVCVSGLRQPVLGLLGGRRYGHCLDCCAKVL